MKSSVIKNIKRKRRVSDRRCDQYNHTHLKKNSFSLLTIDNEVINKVIKSVA